MSTTAQLFEKSGYSLKYQLGSDENEGTVDIPQSTLAIDAAAGPLKALLQKPLSGAKWAALIGSTTPADQKNAPLSIHVTNLTPVSQGSAQLLTVGPNNVLEVGLDGGGQIAIVEIRFHHSEVR